jgi:hypothetical protein
MYAITATGFRAINSSADIQAGETAVETVPQSLLDSIATSTASRDTYAKNIRSQADQALTELRTFRDLASPTNAQVVAVVKLLCRVAIGLIRLQLAKLDGDS